MGRDFLIERIDVTKELIVAYEDALTALGSGVQSYSLNTGQSQQTVTRASVADINRTLEGLYNRLATMQARLTGSGVNRVIPAW